MTEKPILFSSPMIRAILDGRKTQTRRVVSPQPTCPHGAWTWWPTPGHGFAWPRDPQGEGCPYDADRLWVRETWRVRQFPRRTIELHEHDTQCIVEHDDEAWWERWGKRSAGGRWQPSIYMPRWASRLTLAVKSIRVERLHDITEEDARAEGVERSSCAQHFAADPDRDYGWENYLWHGRPEASRSLVDAWPHQFSNYSKGAAPARGSFSSLWQSINGKRPGCSWDSNCWVWVVTFRREVA